MIYTSYFAKYRGDNGISIARSQPKSKNPYPELESLKPPAWLLKGYKNGTISETDYKHHYRRQLAQLNAKKYGSVLQDKVLLCWEKSGRFCHRQIVAQWLRRAGFEVEELEGTNE